MPVDWVGLLGESQGKLQSFWSARLREHRKEQLLQCLSADDRVDLRSCGGPGAGGFLEPPVPFEDEAVKLAGPTLPRDVAGSASVAGLS